MYKKLICFLLAVVSAFTLFMVSGCGKPKRNDGNFLEIYSANFGYKTAWLDALIEDFKKQDWIKEKYSNLDISYSKNSERNYAIDRIMSGPTNTIDLFFGVTSGTGKFEGTSGESFFENIEDVYNSPVPGESVTVAEKMDDNFLKMNAFEKKDGTKTYYSMPWVSGMQGMLYNKTQFAALGIAEPKTTDELYEVGVKIVNNKKVPFVFSSKENYWSSMMFLLWWAQYEGNQNYTNFYNGIAEVEGVLKRSEDVFKQIGRQRSLETIQSLIFNTNDPLMTHANVNTLEFAHAQSQFLLGNGLMLPNGDWFQVEMGQTMIEDGITDEFTFMKTPVISEIVEKLENTAMTDTTLREIIEEIDNGAVSSAKCSEKDFAKIFEARNLVLALGNNTAMIPSYSTSKNLAKDFLRFMATDQACNSFIKATKGASLPFEYDVEEKDKALYDSLPVLQKARLNMLDNAIFMTNENAHRMVYYGGISRLSQSRTNVESLFTAQGAGDRKTAQQIYNDEIAYWTNEKFQSALFNAGLV